MDAQVRVYPMEDSKGIPVEEVLDDVDDNDLRAKLISFDQNKNGHFSASELVSVAKELVRHEKAIAKLHMERNKLDIHEVAAAVSDPTLKETIKNFDVDKDGLIDVNDVIKIAQVRVTNENIKKRQSQTIVGLKSQRWKIIFACIALFFLLSGIMLTLVIAGVEASKDDKPNVDGQLRMLDGTPVATESTTSTADLMELLEYDDATLGSVKQVTLNVDSDGSTRFYTINHIIRFGPDSQELQASNGHSIFIGSGGVRVMDSDNLQVGLSTASTRRLLGSQGGGTAVLSKGDPKKSTTAGAPEAATNMFHFMMNPLDGSVKGTVKSMDCQEWFCVALSADGVLSVLAVPSWGDYSPAWGGLDEDGLGIDLLTDVESFDCQMGHCFAYKKDKSAVLFGRGPMDANNGGRKAGGTKQSAGFELTDVKSGSCIVIFRSRSVCSVLKNTGEAFIWAEEGERELWDEEKELVFGLWLPLTNIKSMNCHGFDCFSLGNDGVFTVWGSRLGKLDPTDIGNSSPMIAERKNVKSYHCLTSICVLIRTDNQIIAFVANADGPDKEFNQMKYGDHRGRQHEEIEVQCQEGPLHPFLGQRLERCVITTKYLIIVYTVWPMNRGNSQTTDVMIYSKEDGLYYDYDVYHPAPPEAGGVCIGQKTKSFGWDMCGKRIDIKGAISVSCASDGYCASLHDDGRVVVWEDEDSWTRNEARSGFGGVTNAKSVQCHDQFAGCSAVTEDNDVVLWGINKMREDSKSVMTKLTNKPDGVDIACNNFLWADKKLCLVLDKSPPAPAPVPVPVPATPAPAPAPAPVTDCMTVDDPRKPAVKCVLPFVYRGNTHYGCSDLDSPEGAWCYTDEAYDSWGLCDMNSDVCAMDNTCEAQGRRTCKVDPKCTYSTHRGCQTISTGVAASGAPNQYVIKSRRNRCDDGNKWLGVYPETAEGCMWLVLGSSECSHSFFNYAEYGDRNCGCLTDTKATCDATTEKSKTNIYAIKVEEEDWAGKSHELVSTKKLCDDQKWLNVYPPTAEACMQLVLSSAPQCSDKFFNYADATADADRNCGCVSPSASCDASNLADKPRTNLYKISSSN